MATSFPRNTKQVVESDNAHLKLITPIYVLETLHKRTFSLVAKMTDLEDDDDPLNLSALASASTETKAKIVSLFVFVPLILL